MALGLLDGTTAAVSITIASNEYNGIANYVSTDIGNELFEQTVFATSNQGWRARIRGLKQLVGRIAGFMFTGVTWADPLVLFTGSGSSAAVVTYHTGCTLTFALNPRNVHLGMQAAGSSEYGLDFESKGAVTSAWVTS